MDGWMDGLFLSVMFSSCVIQILHLLHFPTPIQTTNPIQFNPINSLLTFPSVTIIVTGLIALTEIFFDARRKGISMIAILASTEVQRSMTKFGIMNDSSNQVQGLSIYSELGGTIPIKVMNGDESGMVGIGGEEKKGTDDYLEEGHSSIIKEPTATGI